MPDYRKGMVYAIVSECKCYIGSTTQKLKKRINHHKRSAEGKTTGGGSCMSKQLILNPDMKYFVIETYPCETKAELLNRERYWIENYGVQNPECVVINEIVRLNQSREEKLQLKRQWGANFRSKNPDFLKQYYEDNKERISQQSKDYYSENKEVIKARVRKYKEDNKDAIRERMLIKVECDVCGKQISKCNLPRHKKSSNCK